MQFPFRKHVSKSINQTLCATLIATSPEESVLTSKGILAGLFSSHEFVIFVWSLEVAVKFLTFNRVEQRLPPIIGKLTMKIKFLFRPKRIKWQEKITRDFLNFMNYGIIYGHQLANSIRVPFFADYKHFHKTADASL